MFTGSLSPCIAIEQEQHGIELKSAREHVKHEDIFGCQGKMCEVGSGAYGGKAGTDVVESRCHGGEDRLQTLVSVKNRDEKDRGKEDDNVNSDIHDDGTDSVALDRLIIHAHCGDAAGMDIVVDLLQPRLDKDDNTGDLDTAAGGAGAGAAEHDHDEEAS